MLDYKITEFDHEVYEKELKSFLPDKIIDIHTHLGKSSFGPLQNRLSVPSQQLGKRRWTSLMSREMTAEDLLGVYQNLFPKNEVTPLVFGDCIHNIHQVNDYVLETKQKYGYPTLYRSGYDMPIDELEENIIKGGHLGIKPYLNQRPPYIPANETRIFDFLTREQLELANKHGWIVMLHIARNERLKDKVNLAQLLEIEE